MGDKFYLIFPLCTGGELYEAVSKRGHFTEFDAACIMRDLIGALNALHENNVLHLDIKPENILFTKDGPDGKIQLTDFGLSRINDRDVSTTSTEMPSAESLRATLKRFVEIGISNPTLKGTVGYMSPEVILAGVYTRAADMWAAGVVAYILLSGLPPFHSRSHRYY